LTYNNPERNGMLDAIKELDMVLMAYSPLQSGILTGAAPPHARASIGLLKTLFRVLIGSQ
jgi:aryl-alcohol dehydrogenase-like predicted oxidoreductase